MVNQKDMNRVHFGDRYEVQFRGWRHQNKYHE